MNDLYNRTCSEVAPRVSFAVGNDYALDATSRAAVTKTYGWPREMSACQRRSHVRPAINRRTTPTVMQQHQRDVQYDHVFNV